MPHTEQYTAVSSAEVGRSVVHFIAFMARAAAFCLRALKGGIVFAFSVFILLSFFFWFWNRGGQGYYESEMVCAYNSLHKKTFGEMVHRLDLLARSGSAGQLARELQMKPEDTRKIVALDARNVAGSPLWEDINSERSPMYFVATTTDRSIFPELQEKLLNYLNQTPYEGKRIAFEQQKAAAKIAAYRDSRSQIDALISDFGASIGRVRVSADSSSGFANIAALFRYKDELLDKMLEAQRSTLYLQPVEMIYGFAPADKPAVKGRLQMVKGFAIALVIAWGLTVLRALYQYGRQH